MMMIKGKTLILCHQEPFKLKRTGSTKADERDEMQVAKQIMK